MDEIPARHRKKHREKPRKPTETSDPPEEVSKAFSKRELVSNWNKYDDKSTSSTTVDESASNFDELLSTPASIGGHFLFNSEKSWEANDDWYNRDDYFQLNLIELSKSLATIPFYERQNYSKDLFSSEEIDDMNRQAKYHHFKWSANRKNISNVEPSVVEVKDCRNAVERTTQNDDDDLDELLNLTGSGQQKIHIPKLVSSDSSAASNSATIQPSSADSTDDIQKWLDDVLILDS